jgi:hypothetical protein
MNDRPVIRLMAEGALFEIFARTTPEGQTVFRSQSFAMADDPDEWRGGGLPETTNLADVVPEIWQRLYPALVAPEVRPWFRARFDPRGSNRDVTERWLRLLASTPPDEWSEYDPF